MINVISVLAIFHGLRNQKSTQSTYPIIDVRSPSEFADSHIPGAVNIPVLDDIQRQKVGKAYVKEGKHAAVHLGLNLVAETIPKIIDRLAEASHKKKSIIIYCWRGGMRSRSMAELATALGVPQVFILKGGYKAYRNEVLKQIEALAQHPLLVLNGLTGSGKTEFLEELPPDFPFIDFEGLASHRGSAFGRLGMVGEQTIGQSHFENLIIQKYMSIKHHKKIVVEIESALGKVFIPNEIRKHMGISPFIEFTASIDTRSKRLAHIYGDTAAQDKTWHEAFNHGLSLLDGYLTPSATLHLKKLVQNKKTLEAIKYILENRYDPVYKRSLEKNLDRRLCSISTDEGYEKAYEIIKKLINFN